MRAGLYGKGFLIPEECWKLWHSLGSLNKVRSYYLKVGNINPKTGKPPTLGGIEKAAFSWAIDNQDQARKDLEYAWQQEGFILDDEKWAEFLYNASKLVFHQRPRRLEKYINANGLHRFLSVK